MADFVVKNPPEYSEKMRMLETTDPDHADVFNELFGQLINNDAFLEALARATANSLVGHTGDGAIHVTAQDKQEWNAKAGADEATQSTAGLMGAVDKKKLDGVAEGAEVNQNAYTNIKVGSITITANGKTATFTIEAGENVTLTADNAAKKITIKANRDGGDADTVDGYHASAFASSNEVDDLKKSVSDGKSLVAAAITAKGVTTAADAAFATIATNVAKITTGVDTSDATATAGDALTGKTFYAGGKKVTGSMTAFGSTDSGSRNVVTAQESLGMGSVVVGMGRPIRTVASPTVIKTSGGNYVAGAYVNDEERNLYIPKANGQFIAGFPQSAVASAIGLTADKIARGATILGIDGTLNVGTKYTFTKNITPTDNQITADLNAIIPIPNGTWHTCLIYGYASGYPYDQASVIMLCRVVGSKSSAVNVIGFTTNYVNTTAINIISAKLFFTDASYHRLYSTLNASGTAFGMKIIGLNDSVVFPSTCILYVGSGTYTAVVDIYIF